MQWQSATDAVVVLQNRHAAAGACPALLPPTISVKRFQR
jgi:hypothetical protein